jgi:hypothetical protein
MIFKILNLLLKFRDNNYQFNNKRKNEVKITTANKNRRAWPKS